MSEPAHDDRLVVEVHGGQAHAAVQARELPPTAETAAQARAWLLAAQLESDPDRSAELARHGLDVLGRDYLDRDDTSTVDDTEMKVLGADTTDVPSERAALLTRALEARLQMYAWRYEDLGLSFDPPLQA